jgi:excisionase family DNA binding protein
VAALGAQVARLTAEVSQMRAGQAAQLGRPEDAMRLLGISRPTFWRQFHAGKIPGARKVGRSVRVDLAALTAPAAEGQS